MRLCIFLIGAWTIAAAAAVAQPLPQLEPLRQQPPVQPQGQPPAQPTAQPGGQPAVQPGGQPAAQPGGQPAGPTPTTVKERASYFVGISLANRLLDQGLLVDLDWLFRGFSETFAGQKPALSQEEMVAAIRAFEEEVTTQMAERDRVLAEQNKQREAEFLAQNRNQPGVVVLPSGLQYAILKAGDGPKPKPTDVVRVHYRGVLLDGTEFDTSLDSATPAEFPVNQVIDGWTEALQLMPTGSQWRLFVPAALAYKDQRNGRVIGPNATLVFDVELLAIVGSVGGAVQP